MATTTNYSWATPDDTDLVKDGAAAIRTLGSSIDTTVFTGLTQATSNNQTGTTYTLILSDAGKIIDMNNASAITLTVPLNSSVDFPVGTRIDLVQSGAGQVTVAGAGGVTINSKGAALNITGQWSAATLIQRAANSWVLVGDLIA
jgi:citrate lyase gamma subunit